MEQLGTCNHNGYTTIGVIVLIKRFLSIVYGHELFYRLYKEKNAIFLLVKVGRTQQRNNTRKITVPLNECKFRSAANTVFPLKHICQNNFSSNNNNKINDNIVLNLLVFKGCQLFQIYNI